MDTVKIEDKKSFKKQLFETIHSRLDGSLVQYKEIMGEKKMSRFLKKASKALAVEINKETKQARKRQKRQEKKAAKQNREVRA